MTYGAFAGFQYTLSLSFFRQGCGPEGCPLARARVRPRPFWCGVERKAGTIKAILRSGEKMQHTQTMEAPQYE